MMKIRDRSVVVLMAVLVAVSRGTVACGQQQQAVPETADQPRAGFPIAAARRRAIAADDFHRALESASVRKWMDLSSKCTIAEFELFLGPLSPREERVLEAVRQRPAPIVNRLHFLHLRGVLKNGGIIALELEREARRAQVAHTTPTLENELFGAFDCVFASVGPPGGSPRYGDVIIRLRDSVREQGWATPFSGMHFLSAIRGKDVDAMQQRLAKGQPLPNDNERLSLGFDDRLHYSHYIVTEQEWNQALAYQAILTLRNADASSAGDRIRQRVDAMLGENDPAKFWSLFIPPRESGLSPIDEASRLPLGYLEAKFPNRVSIEYFTSIEVPAERLDEVRSWPEAKPYLPLLRARPGGAD